MSVTSKESALSRWSRRKHEAVQTAPVVEQVPVETDDTSFAAPQVDESLQEPLPLTDADMPDIDSLAEDSDFTGFMSPGVSDELRNLALRKLFHAPVFNIRDGLDEYDEDYTTFEKLGDIVTCDMKHQIEVQERKRLEALEQEEQATADAGIGGLPEDVEDDVPDDVEDIDDEDDVAIEALDDVKQPRQALADLPNNKPVNVDLNDE